MTRDKTTTYDDPRHRQQTSTPPTDSAGWRAEYAAQRVETALFDSDPAQREEREATDEATMKTETCPFCGWSGAANSYPTHLTECDSVDGGKIVADGGRYILPKRGARIHDREATSDGRVLVLDVHADSRADTWVVEELGETVAAVNPEYPDDDPVVAAVYVDALEDAGIADRSPDEVEHAANLGEVGVYHFPASRLAAVEEVEA